MPLTISYPIFCHQEQMQEYYDWGFIEHKNTLDMDFRKQIKLQVFIFSFKISSDSNLLIKMQSEGNFKFLQYV